MIGVHADKSALSMALKTTLAAVMIPANVEIDTLPPEVAVADQGSRAFRDGADCAHLADGVRVPGTFTSGRIDTLIKA